MKFKFLVYKIFIVIENQLMNRLLHHINISYNLHVDISAKKIIKNSAHKLSINFKLHIHDHHLLNKNRRQQFVGNVTERELPPLL